MMLGDSDLSVSGRHKARDLGEEHHPSPANRMVEGCGCGLPGPKFCLPAIPHHSLLQWPASEL